METLRLLADHLSAPPVLFTVAAALFLAAVRSPWPWTRVGGTFLAVVTLAFAALLLLDPLARARIGAPERLPVALLVLASGAGLWLGLHQAQQEPRDDELAGGFVPVELFAGGLTILGVAVLAFAVGAPLASTADPATAASAPWFLLGLAEVGRYFDPWVAWIYLPVLLLAGLAALPFLGALAPRKEAEPGSPDFTERREIVFLIVAVVFLLALLPMASGAFLRGADGEPAGHFGIWRPDAELSPPRPLSQGFWGLLAEQPPRWAWLRELPVLLLALAYFVAPPLLLPRWRPTRAVFGRYLKDLGPRRFNVAMALVLALALVPIKMYGRWLFAIEYFVYLPELGLNF